ncbi:MAG TPA: hypothetical protein VM571_15000 [Noviherbaspirillum sp.]|nr:hypothetical protein [Noviherbaspirillum sp.]
MVAPIAMAGIAWAAVKPVGVAAAKQVGAAAVKHAPQVISAFTNAVKNFSPMKAAGNVNKFMDKLGFDTPEAKLNVALSLGGLAMSAVHRPKKNEQNPLDGG